MVSRTASWTQHKPDPRGRQRQLQPPPYSMSRGDGRVVVNAGSIDDEAQWKKVQYVTTGWSKQAGRLQKGP